MSNIYRDVNLSQVSESDIGKELKVSGWVENIRDHGGVSFIDLRDMYGVLQVVLRDTTLLEGIHKEECICIEGIMEKRDEETYNPKLPTGTIELEAKKITLLGKVYQQLPFEVMTSKEVREDVRLKYRYLDLRNEKVKDNILFRSKVISFLRSKMTEMGFVEIQTPILCASSPEGARDYIVPSRKYKGKFYALPQAPQQYKQLLMVSGIDKYFQIAPCFRDEDARADRSPGEFYQLDFEMSFATQEDVFRVGEEVLSATFEKFAPEGYTVTQAPYPVISYKQAMLEFGSDKPDLRNPLRIIDVTDFFQKCTFKPFIGKTVRAIKVHADMSKGFHEKLLKFATSIGMGGLGYLEVKEDLSYKGPIDKFIPDELKKEFLTLAGLEAGDTIFFMADKEEKAAFFAGQIRNELGEKLDLIEKNAYRFCYVNDFPMFERDPETKKIGFTHNPFSMPQGGLEALKTMDPLDILAYQYDIVCNGIELSSGAVRNHDMEIMVKAFEIAGYDEEVLKAKFGALYNAFQFGAPPHAGMAPGVDRMLMLLRNEENIREVIAFPMSGTAQDLMCGAPNEVTEQQLREVHIKVRD
ncbi:aspartate--tRNA ligase [Lachnospira multipara]|uniref:aspartate--tRNA ligase n=1 Tax=Lachnospira multipara TaxID=28051 RepID=UPI0004870B74|nr:aspartate--tRNA ligase [Lachnospira multipara]